MNSTYRGRLQEVQLYRYMCHAQIHTPIEDSTSNYLVDCHPAVAVPCKAHSARHTLMVLSPLTLRSQSSRFMRWSRRITSTKTSQPLCPSTGKKTINISDYFRTSTRCSPAPVLYISNTKPHPSPDHDRPRLRETNDRKTNRHILYTLGHGQLDSNLHSRKSNAYLITL